MQKSSIERFSLVSAEQIIEKLAADSSDVSTVRTESREEYEILFEAAQNGLFPDRLKIGRTGVWVQKKLVHTPPRGEQ